MATIPTGSLSNECYNSNNVLKLRFEITLPNTDNYWIRYRFRTDDFTILDLPPSFGSTFDGEHTIIEAFIDFSPSAGQTPFFSCFDVNLQFADSFAPPEDNLDKIQYWIRNNNDPNNPILINSSNTEFSLGSYEADFVLTLAPGSHSVLGATVTSNYVIYQYFLNSCNYSTNSLDLNVDGQLTIDDDICVFDSSEESNFYIGSNTDFIIKSGVTARFEKVNFISCGGDWGSIIVEGGGTLILDDCSFSDVSNPIILQDGAELKVINTSFENINTAILAEGSSKMFIENNTFSNCAESGIELNGDVTFDKIEDNTFSNGGNGILIKNTGLTCIFPKPGHPNIFSNNDFGIRIIKGGTVKIHVNEFYDNITGVFSSGLGVEIGNNTFEGSFFGLNLSCTGFSSIFYNTFDGEERAITASYGMYNIQNNIIGESSSCVEGIRLFDTSSFGVWTNTIYAENLGVSSFFSNGEIRENLIEIMGSSNSSYGISTYFHNGDIHGNTLDCSGTYSAISLVNCNGFNVNNNTVNLSGSEHAIDIQSSSYLEVFENLMDGAATIGINCNNSPGIQVICNDYDGPSRGLVTEGASMDMTIETNVFTACSMEDLFISSPIGRQRHAGNTFYGGAFSDLFDFDFDYFIYDDTLGDARFKPVPFTNGLFKFENDVDNESLSCTATIGVGFSFYQNNPDALCQLLARVKKLKVEDDNYEKYWNFMYNLIKHFKMNVDQEKWPPCFKVFVEELDDCGLISLIDAEIAIIDSKRDEKNKAEEHSEEIKRLQTLLSENNHETLETHQGEIIQIQEKLTNTFEEVKIETIQSLEREKSEVDGIECDEEIFEIWKFIFVQNINLLTKEELNPEDLNLMVNHAQLCLSEYGNAIQSARTILRQIENQLFLDPEDCEQERSESRSILREKSEKEEVVFYPNPFNNIINISINASLYEEMYIQNINGTTILNISQLEDQMKINLENEKSGMYILQLKRKDGARISEKIIKY